MINKRLLIKNLLAHNDECSFYDKKLQINITSKEGKAKFLKHVCALSNSNPASNSYIVIGVDDQYNHIIGVDFFDDMKFACSIESFFFLLPERSIFSTIKAIMLQKIYLRGLQYQ